MTFLPTLALFDFGPWELVVLAGLGLLIFGKRLPEVGRSLGRGIVEFKKGLAGLDDEVDQAVRRPSTAPQIEKRSEGKTLDTAAANPYIDPSLHAGESQADPAKPQAQAKSDGTPPSA